MIVYGDLLFLINFSMDFLCFYISCLLLHQKLPVFRTCLSAFVGGVYSVLALFIEIEGIPVTAIDISVLFLMCLTVYVGKNITFGRLLRGIFLYFFVSALLGGFMTATFSLFNRIELLAKDSGITENINVWVFALLAIIGSAFTLKGGRIFKSSSSVKTAFIELENDLGDVELLALVDSGNLAVEPISNKSVIFVSVEKCKKIIESSLYDVLNNSSNINELPLDVLSKIRIIPIRTVSGEVIFYAIKFKRVSVKIGKKKKKLDVYVALVKKEMLGEYDAIISHETII